jgi:hypothetical protein
VPDLSKQGGATYAFIALNQTDQDPLPQTAFSAIGVYNTSHLVLKVLEKYLIEIQETEKLIHRYEDEV